MDASRTPVLTPARSASRRRRAAATQRAVASHLARNGWPHATDTGAGRNGRDILGTPGLAIEVKARRDLNPTAWLRQATATASDDLPLVVFRPDGSGVATVNTWPCLLRLTDLVQLLHAAGYGTPEDAA